MDALLLLLSLALLMKGGDLFAAAATRLAVFLRMPRVVIGSTLVSLATTVPEFVVSTIAGARGNSGIVLGNALGSCVCNIGLILGITATIKRVDVNPRALRPALLTMVGLGIGLFLLTLDLTLHRWQGLLLMSAGAAYFTCDFITAASRRKPDESAETKAIEPAAAGRWAWFQTRAGTVTQFALGACVVVVSSRFVVDGAVSLASMLGIPPLVIGLTIVAVGTSLPELVTALGSARRQVSDLSVGNIIGANISNLSLVIGIAATLTPLRMTRLTQVFDFSAMLGFMGFLVWALGTQHRLTRREGVILIIAYAAYVGCVVAIGVLVGQESGE